MNNQGRLIVLLGWFVLLGLWVMPSLAQAEEESHVWVQFSETAAQPEQLVTAVVMVENRSPIYGADIQLTFDPTQLTVVDVDAATDGVQVQPGDYFDMNQAFVLRHLVDNEAGTVDFALTLLRPAVAVTGSGRLVTVTFRAVGAGEADVQLTRGMLGTADGAVLMPYVENGRISITASPAANTSQEVSVAGKADTTNTENVAANSTDGLTAQSGWLWFGLLGVLLLGGLGVLAWRKRPLPA